MELKSFKELLIKKAAGDENLSTVIRLISDEYLAEEIIESLEKMAASKGDKANSAITSTAGSLTSPDVQMIHDALSHHLSHAKAINEKNPPKVTPVEHTIDVTDHRDGGIKKTRTFKTNKVEMDPVAAQHMETAMHLADLAARMGKHSFGKFSFDHVPTHAWEMNYTSDHTRANKNGQIKYADDQQGLKRRLSGKRFDSYGYLMQEPHDSYKHKGKLRGHAGQYPFEEMKINDKHVVIDPDHYVKKDESGELPKAYTPHEFESHPLWQKEAKDKTWERSEDSRSDADRAAFAAKLDKWHESPEFNSWLDKQDAFEQGNKAKYDSHGTSMSPSMLDGVRRGQPKSSEAVSQGAPKEVQQQTAAPQAKPTAQPQPQAQTAPASTEHPRAGIIRRKAKEAGEPDSIRNLLESYISGDPKITGIIDQMPSSVKKKWGIE